MKEIEWEENAQIKDDLRESREVLQKRDLELAKL
jgi:hypothetical protein